MDVVTNPYFIVLALVLMVSVSYVLFRQENIPAFVFLVFAGMGAVFEATSIGRVALLKAVLLPLLFAVLLFSRMSRGQRLPLINLILLGVFVVLTIVSSWLNGVDFALVRPYIGTLMVALVVAMAPNKEKTARYLVTAIAIWGAINLLAALSQWAGHGWVYHGNAIHTGFRVEGLMGTSTAMGIYFVIALNAVHVLYLQAKTPRNRLILLLAGLGMAVGLLGTLSRASFAAWLVSSLYIQYRLRGMRAGSIVGIFLAAAMVAAVAAALNLDEMMAGRFTSIEHDPSAQERIPLIEEALKFFDKSPVLGVGLSQGALYGADVLVNTHNTYIQKLMENGVVGFVLFAFLLLRAMRSLNKRTAANVPAPTKAYYVGLFAMLAAVLINGFFHDFSYLMPLWILIGVGLMA